MNPLLGKQAGIPMLNPYSQIQPVPKKEGHIPAQPYPTVMIPGIGPCMMIPQENPKLEQNGEFFNLSTLSIFLNKFQFSMKATLMQPLVRYGLHGLNSHSIHEMAL